MKFCSNCGKEVSDQAVVCPHCGCAVQGGDSVDIPSTGLNILSCIWCSGTKPPERRPLWGNGL